MAHVAPAEYARHRRELPDSSSGRDLDSPHVDYDRRRLEPSSVHSRSPVGLVHDYASPYSRSPGGLVHDYASPYSRSPAVGLMNDRSLPPPNNLGLDMALSERLAAIELAQAAKPWPTSAQTKDLIVHVIEAAESVLRDQASALLDKEQENEHLRSVLRVREWELQNSNMEQTVGARLVENRNPEDHHSGHNFQQPGVASTLDRHGQFHGVNHATANRDLWTGNDLPVDPQSSIIVRPNPQLHSEKNVRQPSNGLQGQRYAPTHGVNAALRALNHTEGGAFSQISSPSSSSMSPIRSRRETEPETRTQVGGQGLTQYLSEGPTSNGPWKQESSRAQEKVNQLRKLLSDAAIKEMQLEQEKCMLEKRLSDLHLTVDQYQRDLVETISIRQDVLEENARLSSELKAVKKDATVYASALVPLLAEFNLQPAATDALSIVSGIKALVQHLCNRNNFNEGKPKDSPHSRQHWRSDLMYQSPAQFAPNSPIHTASMHEVHGLEIVPHPPYTHSERPLSPTSPLNRVVNEWELQGVTNQHSPLGADYYSDSGSDRVRRSPYAVQVADPQVGTLSRNVAASDHDIGIHDTSEGLANAEEGGINFGHSSRLEPHERAEPAIRSPQLPTLDEEPNSSASEDEDPLPAIEELCINGKAVLGNKIGASGFSINGTSLCHFQWVRHYRDGTFTYIAGAAQPDYTITADDVDTMILLECTPMDERNRKGEMVRVFANDHNWITLEPLMQEQIDDYIAASQAVFDVKFVGGSSPDSSWELGVLILKRSQYELRRANTKKVVINERYTSETMEIKIPNGVHAQCVIVSSHGSFYFLELEDGRTRDLVVLTIREFIRGAIDRKRAKKRLWLSKK